MSKFKDLLGHIGIRYHSREGAKWWPDRTIPRLGFTVDTRDGVVRFENKKVAKGLSLRHEVVHFDHVGACVLPSVSSLNFVQRIVPDGACQLRRGRNVANESGIVELRRVGDGRAEVQAAASGGPAQRRGMLVEGSGVAPVREPTLHGSRRFCAASAPP